MSTWKFCKFIPLTLALLLTAAVTSTAEETRFLQGEIVVELAPGYDIDTINNQFGTTVRHYLPLHDLYLLDAPGADLPALCQTIADLPFVVFSHPNYLVDPMRGVQSSLPFPDERAAEEKYLDQPASDLLYLDAAHTISTGVDQVIGVIDGGVNLQHQAFNGRVVSGWDYVDNDADADEAPGGVNSGHGTFVAGVIHLVVPDAEIRSYRVCDTEGEADGFVVAEAILQALTDGCDVINVSLSTYEVHQAIARVCEYARQQNVVVVCAAGNEYSDVGHYPGSDVNTVSVAAIDTTLELADYSDYGQHITLVAPGTDIYAPFLGDGYAWWSGTSFAAPFATAEIAMMRSVDPSMTWERLVDMLEGSAINVDQVNIGYTGLLGAGFINPYGAVLNMTAACGDADGSSDVSITDLVKMIDAMYISPGDELPHTLVGLDGHAYITNNDLAALAVSQFASLSLCYCNPVFDQSFPPAADTIFISTTEVPAHVEEWTVLVSALLTEPSYGVAVALDYDIPGETVRLTNVGLLSSPSLGPFFVEDSLEQRFALAEINLSIHETTPRAYSLARLTFSVTPADTARRIQFVPTTYGPGDIAYTNVVSKLDAARSHIQGWQPEIVTIAGGPDIDSYGHLCVGVNRGNVDMDPTENVDIVDVSVLVDHLFLSGAAPIAVGEADVAPQPHPDGALDITDLQTLIDHLFISLQPLPTCYD